MNETLTLNSGYEMPLLGLGTWKSKPGSVEEAVRVALLEAKYAHIDGAAIYSNEQEIGGVYKDVFGSGKRRREEVFITSKLWNSEHKTADVRVACEKTLRELDLEYLDLYLMHWGIAIPHNPDPNATYGPMGEQLNEQGYLVTENVAIQETWRAMEELVRAGLVKSIGVSNFTGPMLVDLLSYAHIPPAVNQVEMHPYLPQHALLEYCTYKNIVVTAYSPLGSPGNHGPKGKPDMMADPNITSIAKGHKKTPAQVLIRWAIQRGTTVIPKSVTPSRIIENAQVFDFALTESEMRTLNTLGKNFRYANATEWWKLPYFD
ncbi:MAG TPA: aldo/keto reductase [Patescibacteria group bacterium]|nr:aldo/keto reductase [Patescibacteria group bacterium]